MQRQPKRTYDCVCLSEFRPADSTRPRELPGGSVPRLRRHVSLGLCLMRSNTSYQAPPFETWKVTENVYIFRYVGHQSMFVVTPVGVIATDPIGYLRPQKDKILFSVDFIPIETVQFRDMPDGYLPDWFASLDRVLAMDWDRMIPGHPSA